MILFIGREEMTQRQLVKFSEDVRTKDLISCFQGGYCVINSKREVNQAQISKLLEEIEAIVQQNGGQVYTQEMYEAVDRMRTKDKTQKKEEMGKGHENQPKPNQDTSLEVQKVDSVIGVNVKCGIVIPPKKQEESVKSLPEKKGEMAAKFVTENFKIQEETRKERERKKWEEERGATGGVKPQKKKEESVKSLPEKKGEMAAKFVKENFRIQEETRKERERKKWEEERGATGGVQPQKKQEESVKSLPEKKGEMAAKFVKENFRIQEETRKERERKKWEEERGATGGVQPDPVCDVRIVLLGGVGAGKSSSGNTILGREAFGKDIIRDKRMGKRQDGMVGNKSITVIDTKGYAKDDSQYYFSEYCDELEQCLSLCRPGPHVFVLVVPSPNNFSFPVHLLYERFGPEVLKRTLVLITHGDSWGRDHKAVLNNSSVLQQLIQHCGEDYHIFNNQEKEDQTQVKELLQKIEILIRKNGQGYCTTKMYQRKGQEPGSCSLI
ncbi:neurofilament medium polypeptide-like isoform X2 [Neoarius graeffei]|uniref:neurofilament medium polypeptide-like isoform X2 n=1 Tax=Neoarius graeffei TaxID=443677 RepID=UPI00298BD4A5|nr:neurofilament medium polypeptide-like isoform X2 [Neoarius graeffei]